MFGCVLFGSLPIGDTVISYISPISNTFVFLIVSELKSAPFKDRRV